MSAFDKQEGGSHYKNYPIQPVEFITKNKLGFLEGCVIKRVCRWRAKNGIEDLRKAIHELELLIEMEEAGKDVKTPGPALDGYYLGPGQGIASIPSHLADGTIIWEWVTGAEHRRVGVLHRGQLVRDPPAS